MNRKLRRAFRWSLIAVFVLGCVVVAAELLANHYYGSQIKAAQAQGEPSLALPTPASPPAAAIDNLEITVAPLPDSSGVQPTAEMDDTCNQVYSSATIDRIRGGVEAYTSFPTKNGVDAALERLQPYVTSDFYDTTAGHWSATTDPKGWVTEAIATPYCRVEAQIGSVQLIGIEVSVKGVDIYGEALDDVQSLEVHLIMSSSGQAYITDIQPDQSTTQGREFP